MGLESGTYISSLNASNPVGASDPKSQGDDHLRLIKSTLLNTFPNVTGEMTASHTELNILDGAAGKTGTGNVVFSASPTLTGTLSAAAITASGTVTGNLFSGSGASLTNLYATKLTGEIADARLSDNVPLLDTGNIFTGAIQQISNVSPRFQWLDTDGGTDAGLWRALVNAGSWRLDALNDEGGLGGTPIKVDRTGTNIDRVALTADSITANGAEIVTTAGAGLSKSSASLAVDNTVVRTSGSQTIGGAKTFTSNITMSGTRSIDATTRLNLTGATVSVGESGGDLGFFGSAGDSKPTVTGVRDVVEETSNIPALQSLLNALQDLGLITNNTTTG